MQPVGLPDADHVDLDGGADDHIDHGTADDHQHVSARDDRLGDGHRS